MDRLARLATRRPRAVLALAALLVALAALVGGGVVGDLKTGGFAEPSAPSARAAALLAARFGVEPSDLVLLVTADAGDVDSPAVAAAGRAVVAEAAATRGVHVVASYWDLPPQARAGLRSTDGRRALVLLGLDGDETQAQDLAASLTPRLTGDRGPVRVQAGGARQGEVDTNTTVAADLARAESLAVPLTLLLLVVVFGSLVAGLLPLLVGGTAIAGTFAALAVLARLTDVSVFALNLTTALGIGLGVDYALLVVSRHREELAAGRSVPEAVTAALTTAGRTILFSAATVAVALAALLVFPLYFLRSFAYAGIAVVAVGTVAALVVLPALLVVLGPRLERGRLPFLRRRSAATSTGGGWARLASFVMRRPVLAAVPVLVVLAVGALPLASLSLGVPDDRVLQPGVQARQVGDVLRTAFADQETGALQVALPELRGGAAGVHTYASALSALPGVRAVRTVTGTYADGRYRGPAAGGAGADATGSWLTVVPAVDPNSAAAEDLVRAVRAVPSPGPALVAGAPAALVDGKASVAGRLPLAVGLVATTTFVLLFLFTGSVVLPLKALLLNLASLGSVLGAMVWVFVEGHGASLLGFTPGPLPTAMPVLLFCVAFGLSMDYEVFLLGRIKEEHDLGADTRTAVATGLARTGRVVTLAAALLSITFFAFTTSGVSFIQFFGLGSGLAVVVDATLVRAVLVPALMRVMGEANWWAPAPLRRLHDRFGLSEAPPAAAEPAPRPVLV